MWCQLCKVKLCTRKLLPTEYLYQFHTNTNKQSQVTNVLVPYQGFSAETDQCFLSANTRPLMIAQKGTCIWIRLMGAMLDYLHLSLSIIQSHTKAMTSPSPLRLTSMSTCIYLDFLPNNHTASRISRLHYPLSRHFIALFIKLFCREHRTRTFFFFWAACHCFWLLKTTVVQVSSQQSNADRQACKRTAKHLCFSQRSFLSYNWLSCPTCGFSYKTLSSSRSPLHLPEEHRGRRKVLSKMSFLFQRTVDVHGSWIPVLALR